MTRHDVTFRSGGEDCAGWYFVPEGASTRSPIPAVAMAHGLGATRELHIESFARAFAAAGIAALLFDYRYFGGSGGEPRQQVVPAAQLEDYRNAITWLAMQPEIDAARLGVWGTSFSGGHVLHLGAYDPRVKAVVSQVAGLDIHAVVRAIMPPEALAMFDAMIVGERLRGYDAAPQYIPMAAPEGQLALQANTETYEWLMRAKAEVAPHYDNRVTADSIERVLEYAPGLSIARVAPKPLLMILAEDDAYTPATIIREAYARAGEPKRLLALPGGHYSAGSFSSNYLVANGRHMSKPGLSA